MLTFAFMHHPYLVCILFGMPSLHLYTFLLFPCILIISRRGLQHTPIGGVAHTWLALRLVLNCNGQLLALCCARSSSHSSPAVWTPFPKASFRKKDLCGDRSSSPGLTSGPGCTMMRQTTWLTATFVLVCDLNNLLSLMSNVTHQVKHPPTVPFTIHRVFKKCFYEVKNVCK